MIQTNKEALRFEEAMQLKVLILASLFYSRHQGGSESIDGFIEFSKKFEAQQSGDFAFKTALNT